MSHFQKKLAQIKQSIHQKQLSVQNTLKLCPNCNNSHCDICHFPKQEKQQIHIQQPIILQKKNTVGKTQANGFVTKNKTFSSSVTNLNPSQATKRIASSKLVQPFVPVNIPTRDKRNFQMENALASKAVQKSNGNKQILIHIDQDENKNKQCLKKLFKKVNKLTEDLAASEKERMRLGLQLQNYKNISKSTNEKDKLINKLEGENYKLSVELDLIRKQIADRDREVQLLRIQINKKPKQIIKEIIVEKPVEIQVEVPRMIPGPERIVEKIVQVPKYVQVERTVEVQRQVPKQVTRTVQVEKIVYVDKPIYIDKPFYVDRPFQKRVQVPVEIPIQVPVYLDRPIVEEQSLYRIKCLEAEIEALLQENSRLHSESQSLRATIQRLDNKLTILRQHNAQKNKEVQVLLHNSVDYQPISPSGGQRSYGNVSYTVSSNAHRRII